MVKKAMAVKEVKETTVPVPIRMTEALRGRVRRAARRMRTNSSAVMRFAIANQLPAIEAGEITLHEEEA